MKAITRICLVFFAAMPFAALAVIHSECARAAGDVADQPIPVQVASVDRRDVHVKITDLGIVQAYSTITIRSRVDGELEQVLFKEGQDVLRPRPSGDRHGRASPASRASLSAWFIRHPIGTSLIMAGLLVLGIASFPQLAVAPLPEVDFPTLQVSTSLPGASPEIIASSVTPGADSHEPTTRRTRSRVHLRSFR